MTVFLWEYLKKESSLCTYFFERNLNQQSEFRKNHLEKSTSHRGSVSKEGQDGKTGDDFEKKILKI